MTDSSTKRILFIVLLSLAVHVAIFALWTGKPVTAPQAGGKGLTVALLVQAQRTTPSQTTTKEQPPAKPQPRQFQSEQLQEKPVQAVQAVVKKPAQKNVATIAETIIPPAPEPVNTPPKSPAAQTRAPVIARSQPDKTAQPEPHQANTDATTNRQLASVLQKAFNAEFYYPRLAIRRGWQGKVQLGLRIEADGHLSDIRIMQGSGYDLLDNAAIKSLNKVEMLPTAVTLLDGRSLELVLPVEYRLL